MLDKDVYCMLLLLLLLKSISAQNPTFNANDIYITEGTETRMYISRGSFDIDDIRIEFIDGTAISPDDYEARAVKLSFTLYLLIQTETDEIEETESSFSVEVYASDILVETFTVHRFDDSQISNTGRLVPTELYVSEGMDEIQIPIDVTAESNFTMMVTSVDVTASEGADYTLSPDSFDVVLGESTAGPLILTVINDTIVEPEETFYITLIINGTETSMILIHILDNDEPEVIPNSASFDTDELVVVEGSEPVEVPITVTASTPFTLKLISQDESTDGDSDYTLSPASIEVAEGDTQVSFTLSVNDNAIAEPRETLFLFLEMESSRVGVQVVRIDDNDEPDPCFPSPCLSEGKCSQENDGFNCACELGYTGETCNIKVVPNSAKFATVELVVVEGTAPVEVPITVAASTPFTLRVISQDESTDGTSDYNFSPTSIPVAEGDRQVSFTLSIFDDNVAEPRETLFLFLEIDSLRVAVLVVQIVDNDEPDPCSTSPCLNEGTCSQENEGFVCTCEVRYTGETCGIKVEDCASLPCLNNGTCYSLIDGFLCICPPGYTGESCNRMEERRPEGIGLVTLSVGIVLISLALGIFLFWLIYKSVSKGSQPQGVNPYLRQTRQMMRGINPRQRVPWGLGDLLSKQ